MRGGAVPLSPMLRTGPLRRAGAIKPALGIVMGMGGRRWIRRPSRDGVRASPAVWFGTLVLLKYIGNGIQERVLRCPQVWPRTHGDMHLHALRRERQPPTRPRWAS